MNNLTETPPCPEALSALACDLCGECDPPATPIASLTEIQQQTWEYVTLSVTAQNICRICWLSCVVRRAQSSLKEAENRLTAVVPSYVRSRYPIASDYAFAEVEDAIALLVEEFGFTYTLERAKVEAS